MILGEICDLIIDCEHKTAPKQKTGYPSIRTPNIGRGYFILDGVNRVSEETYRLWTRRAIPKPGDLIMAREAPVGNVAIIPPGLKPCLGQRTLLIRCNTAKAEPSYISYLLNGPQVQGTIHGMTNGAIVPHLNMKDVRTLPIPEIPHISTQHKIAAILSAYDNLIENNLRRIKVLEEMAQNLYREWFVKFRFPGHPQASFVDSPLGRIPEGWKVVSISDVATTHRGRSYKGSELADEGGRPFINLKCMQRDGGFRSSGLKRYTGPFKNTHTVRAGEMVMAITDMTQERRIVARVGRVSKLDADFGVFSMDLVRVASRDILSEPYLYAMFRWSGFADKVKQHANGANVLHLLPARIGEYRFVFPSSDIAHRFSEIALSMLSLCDSLEQKNITLRRTRDLLLPKLISGEVDVSELDITIPMEIIA